MKITFLIFSFLTCYGIASGQIKMKVETENERLISELAKAEYQKKEIVYLKALYAQEPKLLTATKEIQDTNFLKLLDTLDKGNPLGFYYKAMELISNFKPDQAAFLMNLGQLRFKYYNLTNPEYTKSGDGALATSLNYMLAEPISQFYKANVDNYIAVLNACIAWHAKHDYEFVTSNRDTSKYHQLTHQMTAVRDNYLNNKETFQKRWNEDVLMFLENADKELAATENKVKDIKSKLRKLK